MEAKIKLIQIGEPMEDGTLRLQNQLSFRSDSASHILKDGILKVWGNGDKGFNFYETNIPYEIVHNASEMRTQQL